MGRILDRDGFAHRTHPMGFGHRVLFSTLTVLYRIHEHLARLLSDTVKRVIFRGRFGIRFCHYYSLIALQLYEVFLFERTFNVLC